MPCATETQDAWTARLARAEAIERGAASNPAAAAADGRMLEDDALAAAAQQPDQRAPAVIARIRRATTLALSYEGRLEEAVLLARRNREDASAMGLGIEAARALLSIMHPLLKLGRSSEALAAGDQARSEFTTQDRPELAARADINLGNIHKSLGNAEKSLQHLDRAKQELGDDGTLIAHIENTRGEVLFSLDRFDDARAAFLAALDWARSTDAGFAAAVIEGNLADLDARSGRLHEALERFARARGGVAARGHAARLLLEEADVLLTLGLPRAAAERLQEGLVIVEELGLAFEIIRAHQTLARAKGALGEYAAAHEHASRAAQRAAAIGHRAAEARAFTLDAILLVNIGSPSAAWDALELADALEADPSPSDAVSRAIARSRCLESSGRLDEALHAAVRAADVAVRVAAAPLESDALVQVSRLRRRRGDGLGALAPATAAVEAAERVRSSLGADRLRGAYLGRTVDAYEELVIAELEVGGMDAARRALEAAERAKSRSLVERLSSHASQVGAAPGVSPWRGQLDRAYRSLAQPGVDAAAVHAIIADLERRLMHEELDALRGSNSAAPLAEATSVERVQSVLGVDDAIVEYFRAAGQWHVFVIESQAVRHFALSVTDAACGDALRRLGFQMRRALRASASKTRASVEGAMDSLSELGKMLWEPMAETLPKRLTIVPHGPLHSIPFAALQTRGEALIDHHELSTLPSSGLLPLLRTRTRPRKAGSLVVGVPDRMAPAIADEAVSVARALGATALVGASATAASVASALARVAKAHIACHGQFIPEAPWSSGLRLADSWFGIRQVLELHSAPDMVVLSGCETGGHEVLAGDELVGLAHAFLARGTRAIVASHWSTHDRSTTDLMLDMYSDRAAIADHGRVAASLRAAQLKERDRSPHPAFWASFFVTGD